MEQQEKEIYLMLIETRQQLQSLREDVFELKASHHEIREEIIKPILAWQNRAIGIMVAITAMGNYLNDLLQKLLKTP